MLNRAPHRASLASTRLTTVPHLHYILGTQLSRVPIMSKVEQAIFSGVMSTEREKKRSIFGMAVNIKPLHDRVIVRRIEEGEQVRGGIIIPDTAKEKPQ